MITSDKKRFPENSKLEMSDDVFCTICSLAKSHAGLLITPKKKALVQSRITRRLHKLNLNTFEDYANLVTRDKDKDELKSMICALTTNVSSFFREDHHFVELENQIIPDLLSLGKKGETIRIWSAGCSSGQEAYTISMLLNTYRKDLYEYDIKILATDIDYNILETAKSATYDRDALKEVPSRFHRYFRNLDDGNVAICPEIKNIVRFNHLNLLDRWPMRNPFDLIFCRNVLIYFDEDTQRNLWPRFRHQIKTNGFLFLGHSERIDDPAGIGFQPVGITQYQAV